MKKILVVIVLMGLGCSPDGYREKSYPPYMQDLSDRNRWDEGPDHWPLGPIDRDDPD
jgi:hypothetical protein